jgi:leucine-rich repeat protein SHOC2
MAPSKRRKTSAASQPASGNKSSGVQTRRSASARGDLPDAPDADLDAEPEELLCPITRAVFRDPVVVVDSGHTYERSAILSHFGRNGARDPLTRRALSSTKVMTNWAVRQIVQAWLDKHPSVTPDGWDSRELLEPSKDEGIFDDEGVLRTWRAICPALQERWPEAARPEGWEGVTMENGRVVELELEDFGLTGAVPAEIGRLSALRVLSLGLNQLTSVPVEVGQLTSLTRLSLSGNQLTSVPAEIGQLTSLVGLYLRGNQLTNMPAEIGQLTSLTCLWLCGNQLTSVPAEVGRLTSLRQLVLSGNQLTSVPAEIGQLTALTWLNLERNQLISLPAAIRELRAAGCRVYLDDGMRVDDDGTRTFDDEGDVGVLRTWRAMCPELQERWPEAARPEDWEGVTMENGRVVNLEFFEFGLTGAVPAEIGRLSALRTLDLSDNQLTSLPAEIGQLTALRQLFLYGNQLTSVPAEIGQLTLLTYLGLCVNQLTSVPAAIRELRAAGCDVRLDDGVRVDE